MARTANPGSDPKTKGGTASSQKRYAGGAFRTASTAVVTESWRSWHGVDRESDPGCSQDVGRGQQRASAAKLGGVATDRLQALLERAFSGGSEIAVQDRTGGGDHFQVTVTSPRFAGLSLVEQHRLVYDALAEPLRDGTIHELRIKTKGTE